MALTYAGSIVLGLGLVVIAGCLNGSWNASFSPTHGLAVGRKTLDAKDNPSVKKDLSYHLAWILFQTYAALINIPICLYWAGGPARVQYIVQETSGVEITLVCVFSILWGIGSVGFGLACKVAGVGLGTNLCMGVIMVLGTFLPLCLDGAIATPAGGVVVAGLLVCCAGLVYSVQSLQLRDFQERELHQIRRRTMYNTTVSISFPSTAAKDVAQAAAAVNLLIDDDDNDADDDDDDNDSRHVQESHADAAKSCKVETATSAPLQGLESLAVPEVSQELEEEDDLPSTYYKVAVCVVAGVFASQMQFAFVFGDGMIAIAEDSTQGPGSTPPSGTSAIIWLFAISLGAPPSIIYGLYSNPPDTPLDRIFQCPWYRHLLILLTTALPWVAHIHLYGYANTFLPSDLAASVAWPILMMMTVLMGMVWSIGLGEWNWATVEARWKLYKGLGLVTLGISVIMSSVAI